MNKLYLISFSINMIYKTHGKVLGTDEGSLTKMTESN